MPKAIEGKMFFKYAGHYRDRDGNQYIAVNWNPYLNHAVQNVDYKTIKISENGKMYSSSFDKKLDLPFSLKPLSTQEYEEIKNKIFVSPKEESVSMVDEFTAQVCYKNTVTGEKIEAIGIVDGRKRCIIVEPEYYSAIIQPQVVKIAV